MTGLVGIIILMLFLFLLEMPVGFAMALVGLGGMWYVLTPEAALSTLGTEIWETFANYGLTVIPMFILMGQICFYSGVNESLYKTAYTWMGRIRGGLAMATVMACAGFAAICGSNTATAATMTSVALPQMKKYGYQPILSTASVACGSTLGVVIPPSVVLMVYGIYTEQSIGKLFWGSTFPGLIMTFLFCVTIFIMCMIRPEWGPSGEKTSWLDKIRSIPGAVEMIVLFTLIMGGLYSGAYTPTEAGAAGAFFCRCAGTFTAQTHMEGIRGLYYRHFEDQLHDHHHRGGRGDIRAVSYHQRPSVSDNGVRRFAGCSAMGHHVRHPDRVRDRWMRHGRPGILAGIYPDLFPSGDAHGI